MKKHRGMPLAASALALAMVGLTAGGAQAATHTYSGAKITFFPRGEVLQVEDTKNDGRYIYVMGQYAGTNINITPFCSTRGVSINRCNYEIKEGKRVNFLAYSIRGTDWRRLGDFYETA
ncbi:hypothetical protein ACFYNL_06185 [Streptomyces sp. NPDC007808]|uniref:hypothetical protein n=1 Tax=Streptomyces sp. NPDC007808 TaxID=3364779 RepID=UPI0036CD7A81